MGIAVLMLTACATNDGSEQKGELQKSQKEINPDFADLDDSADTLHEPVSIEDFEPETIPSNTEVTYDLDVKMEEEGNFQLNASSMIESTSDDAWEELVFYVIPNALTEENKPDEVGGANELDIESVQVDGENVPYSLENDTLALELEEPLEKGEEVEADIAYTFSLPEDGFRFTQSDEGYFLGQFYPMLATYRDGWNKEDYNPTGESYHTDFSDFTVNYEIPDGYTVFSSDESENDEEATSGEFSMENIKEFYMAVLKTDAIDVHQEDHDGTEVRLITEPDDENAENSLDIAVDSLDFFEKHIGEYPHNQLDVIVTETDEGGMEYPGIVTVMDNPEGMKEVIPHELGHQWFYGMVSNDAYYDPWVDEGITQFLTTIYLANREMTFDKEELLTFIGGQIYEGRKKDTILPANHSLDTYDKGDNQMLYSLSVYSQPTYELYSLFAKHDGEEEALEFLHDYFEEYQYEQVDSEELLNYLASYLDINDEEDFENWLEVENKS